MITKRKPNAILGRADQILTDVTESSGLDESLKTGIALMIDVEKALGVSEHIRTLETKNPVS
jgi:hypothetical protein